MSISAPELLCCQPCLPSVPSISTTEEQQQQSSSKTARSSMHPKTISAGTAATVSSRSTYSTYSNTSASIINITHHASSTASSAATTSVASSPPSSVSNPHHLCPVTGLYANINDDYFITSKILGKGHYGIVRECIHRATRTVLAVKSVDKAHIGRLDHLEREIFLLANIDHTNIMKMVDCYEDSQYVHIVTEKYTGGELFDKILSTASSNGCMSERKTARIIKSLLEAVAYLHDNGIVHRDIKPENILFQTDQEDDIKLIDFGLARRHDKGDAPMSNPVGTSYYMSPELLRGKYDKSCDVWSVGVVTYILLSGYPPFNGNSDSVIQDAARKGKLHFSGNSWICKSDDAMDFITCLLTKDPRKRLTAKQALCHPWLRKHVM